MANASQLQASGITNLLAPTQTMSPKAPAPFTLDLEAKKSPSLKSLNFPDPRDLLIKSL